jgi:2-polyprenyl-6-methoxyphenol hydroxylase-like FAD-dependent oxidoreductase
MEKLRRLAAAFPAPIPSLVAATASNTVVQTDLYDLVPLKQWHCGRVVLMGDAAHATTPNLGQGAAQAIEDAYCLADMLAHNAIPEVAFTAFQKARRAKANEIVRQSWLLGKIAQISHPVTRGARNLAFKALPEFVIRRSMDRMLRVTF